MFLTGAHQLVVKLCRGRRSAINGRVSLKIQSIAPAMQAGLDGCTFMGSIDIPSSMARTAEGLADR